MTSEHFQQHFLIRKTVCDLLSLKHENISFYEEIRLFYRKVTSALLPPLVKWSYLKTSCFVREIDCLRPTFSSQNTTFNISEFGRRFLRLWDELWKQGSIGRLLWDRFRVFEWGSSSRLRLLPWGFPPIRGLLTAEGRQRKHPQPFLDSKGFRHPLWTPCIESSCD